jgi:hypothetical protein
MILFNATNFGTVYEYRQRFSIHFDSTDCNKHNYYGLVNQVQFLFAAINRDHEEGQLVISCRFTYSRRNLGATEELTIVHSVWQGTTRASCVRK